MLSSFYVRNFRSILDLRLDFSFGEGKAPNGYQNQEVMPFIQAADGTRHVPCMAFFGANASGKTNMLKAFGALDHLVLQGGQLARVFEPNLLNPKFSETIFEIVFYRGNDRFTYRISFSGTAISEEVLRKNDKPVFAIHELKAEFSPHIRSESYSEAKLTDVLRVECTDGESHQTKLFLHRIGLGYPGLHADLKSAFDFFALSMHVFGNDGIFLLPAAVETLASVMGGDKVAALREITDVVRRLDIDISDINIIETKLEEEDKPPRKSVLRVDRETGVRHSVKIDAVHEDVTGNLVLLNFIKHESAGTQRLAGMIGVILHALKTGGVFIVDELECSLHPLLMREIVQLFKKRRHNPMGAQLIFTTHNTDILDDSILRISQIALVRKTVANGTLVRRLVDAKKQGEDIRNVTNFRKQYLAGFYSGVPHPAL